MGLHHSKGNPMTMLPTITSPSDVSISSSDDSTRSVTADSPSLIKRNRHLRRLAVTGLLLGTALLYLWGLGASGNANSFYAAAVQAGTKSWKAFFFGSLDSSNFITVDKPPMSLWPMELAGRIFGFNAWSMLVPQALMGVATVGLLYLTVRRWFGTAAGLIAGFLLAVTPVAVLMFRFNNPDALMTLLLVVAAYGVTRAIDDGKLRWLLVAGTALGFDFLTKSLQPFTVLPALALAYLLAAPHGLRRRIGHVLLAGLAILVSAGWWVLAVALTPAADRPYIGGSTDNSVLGLAFGYNGLSRVTGSSGSGPGGGGGGFGGTAGFGRMFNSEFGTQISWLVPAALTATVALLVVANRAPRTDRTRAAALLWGGWLLVTAGVFSYAGGIIHPYYAVQLAPPIAALVAIGSVVLWRRRCEAWTRMTLAAGVLATAWWSHQLLGRAASWHPELRTAVIVIGVATAGLLLVPPGRLRRFAVAATAAGLIVVGLGSSAYALDTAATVHAGSTPSAGPTSTGPTGFGGTRDGFGGAGQGDDGAFGGGAPGQGQTGTQRQPTQPGGDTATSSAMASLLASTTTKWAAATIGDQSAASLELASGGKAVMAIGGWSGSDPAPTLAQFKAYVAAGQIHYFIANAGGAGGGPGGSSGSSAITSWVESNFTTKTVGNQTVYDLTSPKTGSSS
jgi:4-amino-4-deoxy-L-arabinose transferase-like glycosyltransferase